MIISKRIPSFDALKLFAIYLVVWGHCILWFGAGNCDYNFVYRGIYSFHTQLFMMISGYFSYSSMKMPILSFVWKKVNNLLYPCFLWGGFLWIVYELLYSFQYGHSYISLSALILDYYWLSDFWFLKSCFICYVIAYLGLNSKLKKNYWIIGTLMVSQAIGANYVSFMYPCFLVGLEMKQNDSFFRMIMSKGILFCAFFAIALYFWSPDVWHNSHGIPSDFLDKEVNVWATIFFSRFYRLMIGVIGSLATIYLFNIIIKKEPMYTVFGFVLNCGRYTLEVYILQAILIEKILCNYIKINNISLLCFDLIVTPLIAIVILAICLMIGIITHKNRCVSKFLWGR